jgi:hypothetical protein
MIPDITSVLITPDEKVIGCLGEENLDAIMAERESAGTFILLTDKRVYLKGKGKTGRNKVSVHDKPDDLMCMNHSDQDRDFLLSDILKTHYHNGVVGFGIRGSMLFFFATLIFSIVRMISVIVSGGGRTLLLVIIYAVLMLGCFAMLGSLANHIVEYRHRYMLFNVNRSVYGINVDLFAEADVKKLMKQITRARAESE